MMHALLPKFCLSKRDEWRNTEVNEDLFPSPPYVAKFCPIRGLKCILAVGYENGKVSIEDTTCPDTAVARIGGKKQSNNELSISRAQMNLLKNYIRISYEFRLVNEIVVVLFVLRSRFAGVNF